MVEESVTGGTRIAQLLSSEIHGHERGPLGSLAVVDADTDIEPTGSGAFAYGIYRDGNRLADVYVHPDRARIEFYTGLEAAADVADDEGLEVDAPSQEAHSPRTLVFVGNGAEVKRALRSIAAAAAEERGR